MAAPILRMHGIVRMENGVRSYKDQRVKVNRALVAYRDERNEEYRKTFETRKGDPTIPDSGTHAQLNAQKYQW